MFYLRRNKNFIGLGDNCCYLCDGGSELVNIRVVGIVRIVDIVACVLIPWWASLTWGSIAFLDVLNSSIVTDCLSMRGLETPIND